MVSMTLPEVAMLLGAAAVAAPLAKFLRIGSVLGYLIAGIALGPSGLGGMFSLYEAKEILHVAEFGVVLLLFLIGLELRPARLWAMRSAILGAGVLQVLLTAAAIAVIGDLLFLGTSAALFVGLALALSSTAFALQILEETGELKLRHGRLAFAILLLQDLVAIPLIALAPMFAASLSTNATGMDWESAGKAIAVIVAVMVLGRPIIDLVLRLVARTRVKEAMTAAALLTVIGIAIVMQQVGVSATLGAFIAGAILADSSYRHQLEADIQPFQGLLLGLFFTGIGMALNMQLLLAKPHVVLALVALLIGIKAGVLYVAGRWSGLKPQPSRRLALALSQGGEFAFVLLTAGVVAGVLSVGHAELFALVVTLSMIATPLLLILDRVFLPPAREATPAFEKPPENDGHVIIAGFGRFGQITARILRAKHIPFTALDISPDQIEFVRKFGSQAFFGDASRPDILAAAQAEKARAFVLAIDDVDASLRTAAFVRATYPDLPIYARARNRNHAYRLTDLGVRVIRRETFLSALDLTREVLRGLGLPESEVERTVSTFKSHDERRLSEDYKHFTDVQKLQELARSDAANLEKLFSEDAEEQAKARASDRGPQSTKERAQQAKKRQKERSDATPPG